MEEKLLAILKKEKDFLSGEALGQALGVSRASIWKKILKLKEMGYEIEAVTNKGYRLLDSADILNAYEVQNGLSTRLLGQKVLYYKEVSSTNDTLKEEFINGAPEGTLLIAENQNAGKGRLGHTWHSAKGEGIFMSLLLKPDIPPAEASKLTLITGLSVCQVLREKTGINAQIKWPNDILADGKKITGILTELSAEMDKIHYLIIGIGININTAAFPSPLSQNATSLKILTGKSWRRSLLIQEILKKLEENYNAYIKESSFAHFREEYTKYSATLGKEVDVIGKEPFTALACDITKEGELIVEKPDGEKVVVFSGEVSIRKKQKGESIYG